MFKRWSHASRAAGAAVVLALVAFLWIAFWPNFYTWVSETTTPGQPPIIREEHSSLLAHNGWQILPVILFPVMISVIGLLITLWADTFHRWTRVLLWVNTVVMSSFCILGLASIGMFYLPSAVAMLTSALLTRISGASQPQSGQPRRR